MLHVLRKKWLGDCHCRIDIQLSIIFELYSKGISTYFHSHYIFLFHWTSILVSLHIIYNVVDWTKYWSRWSRSPRRWLFILWGCVKDLILYLIGFSTEKCVVKSLRHVDFSYVSHIVKWLISDNIHTFVPITILFSCWLLNFDGSSMFWVKYVKCDQNSFQNNFRLKNVSYPIKFV